ncbi:MAG: type II toxin-antitoxin system PemK/MazF family toxin [Patescibacteria group bacterium]
MQKDFRKWHDKKSRIDEIEPRPFFHEREIWYCALGANVGFEQDGNGENFIRPIIIFKKFNNEIFWAIPLTRTQKETKYYFQFIFQDNTKSAAILSQIRIIDARRLGHKIGDISKDDFEKLTKKFKDILP